MKKILVLALLSILLVNLSFVVAQSPSCSPSSPCCCKAPNTDQRRCYSDGVCCAIGTSNEYWTLGSCYAFTLTVSGPSTFEVGKKTDIIVTIRNGGSYPDSYDLKYTLISDNPNLILVETNNAYSMSVGIGQVNAVFPKVTLLSSNANGILMVNATPASDATKWKTANITIIEGYLPFSLPEFSNISIIILALFSASAYALINNKRRR